MTRCHGDRDGAALGPLDHSVVPSTPPRAGPAGTASANAGFPQRSCLTDKGAWASFSSLGSTSWASVFVSSHLLWKSLLSSKAQGQRDHTAADKLRPSTLTKAIKRSNNSTSLPPRCPISFLAPWAGGHRPAIMAGWLPVHPEGAWVSLSH